MPLHWHLPFGLLRDLLCGPGADGALNLPWALTVHFWGFPSDVLLPCDNEQSVESHFMHSLKQATFLRMGSTKAVMALPEAQQTQIWTSISQSKEVEVGSEKVWREGLLLSVGLFWQMTTRATGKPRWSCI